MLQKLRINSNLSIIQYNKSRKVISKTIYLWILTHYNIKIVKSHYIFLKFYVFFIKCFTDMRFREKIKDSLPIKSIYG